MSDRLSAAVNLKVPFHDVDPAGLVWHGHYFRYFELARCALLEVIGYNYLQMRDSGYTWPVVDLDARFTRPVRYDDQIEVEAVLAEWEYRLVIEYRVKDPEGLSLAQGRTVQVPVHNASGEMEIGVPEVFEQRVLAALERKAGK